MELQLEIYGHLCFTSIFTVNGIVAKSSDFGIQYDADSENSEEYCCGDMKFIGNPSTIEILNKYKITEVEYREIVSKLENGLSFGCCG